MLKQIAKRVLGPRVVARLKAIRTLRQIRTYKPRIVRHKYGGVELTVRLADPLSEMWYDQDWTDLEAELNLLTQSRLKPGATVFNLGSHQAIAALAMEKLIRPCGRVVAVEANRHNCEAARENAVLNSAAALVALHGAVAARSGRVMFTKGLTGQVDDGATAESVDEVDAYSIDDLAAQHGTPAVLFIDVEGYECEALAGATQTLQSVPDCFVEVHVNAGLEKFGGSVSRVLASFPQSNYRLLVRSEGGTYAEFALDMPLVEDRFFLMAISRRPIQA